MLRMSKLTDYATVIMAYLAREPQQQRAAAEVAGALQVALPTVSKVLKALSSAGLVTATRGAKGGYSLAYPPAQISLTEIIEAMEGPIGLTECGSTPGLCTQEARCAVKLNWQRINRAVLQALDGVRLTDMIAPQPKRLKLQMIQIDTSRKPRVGRAINE